VLDGDRWLTPRSGHFTTGKTRYPLYRRLDGHPGPVWTGAENLADTGIDPRTVQHVSSRYTDWAIPTPVYTVYCIQMLYTVNHILSSNCTGHSGTQILRKYGCDCSYLAADILHNASVQQVHELSSHVETWIRLKKLLPTSDAIQKTRRELVSWWWWSWTWHRSPRCDNARRTYCVQKGKFTYWWTMPVRATSICILAINVGMGTSIHVRTRVLVRNITDWEVYCYRHPHIELVKLVYESGTVGRVL
jgi:hypothetical protein